MPRTADLPVPARVLRSFYGTGNGDTPHGLLVGSQVTHTDFGSHDAWRVVGWRARWVSSMRLWLRRQVGNLHSHGSGFGIYSSPLITIVHSLFVSFNTLFPTLCQRKSTGGGGSWLLDVFHSSSDSFPICLYFLAYDDDDKRVVGFHDVSRRIF